MPSSLTHYQFGLRVLARRRRQGRPVAQREALLFGAQGPDPFFFHRVFPWQLGVSYSHLGGREHRAGAARLFAALYDGVAAEPTATRSLALAYVQGFLCHYALDRAAHPYVLWAQKQLRQQQPQYGRTENLYHYRIESALDTLVLQRESGRRVETFDLRSVVPPTAVDPHSALSQTVARLHAKACRTLWRQEVPVDSLATVGQDMRHAMGWLSDNWQVVRRTLRPLEWLARHDHLGTSLIRPRQAEDWDYTNAAHREWHNPFAPEQRSRADFWKLYERAIDDALDMINVVGDGGHVDWWAVTQDRGFASDLPGLHNV